MVMCRGSFRKKTFTNGNTEKTSNESKVACFCYFYKRVLKHPGGYVQFDHSKKGGVKSKKDQDYGKEKTESNWVYIKSLRK